MPGSRTLALGATRVLAHFAADIGYEDLPSEAVATLKQRFLDTVAASLAGTTLGAGCEEVAVAHDVSGPRLPVALGELGEVLLVKLGQAAGAASAGLVAAFESGMAPGEPSGQPLPWEGRPLRVSADAEVGKGGKGGLVHEAGMVAVHPTLGLELPVALVAVELSPMRGPDYATATSPWSIHQLKTHLAVV